MDAVVFGKVGQLEKKVDSLEKKFESINKIVDIEHTFTMVDVNKFSQVSLPLDIGTGKFLIKSIFIEGTENSSIEAEIRSSNTMSYFAFYRNTVSSNLIYDQIDIPFIDDDNSDKIHIWIKNNGQVSSSFKVRITGVSAN
jgi:hypothetical protein